MPAPRRHPSYRLDGAHMPPNAMGERPPPGSAVRRVRVIRTGPQRRAEQRGGGSPRPSGSTGYGPRHHERHESHEKRQGNPMSAGHPVCCPSRLVVVRPSKPTPVRSRSAIPAAGHSIWSVSCPLSNAKVSDGSQPPQTSDCCPGHSAGSRSLGRFVRRCCAS